MSETRDYMKPSLDVSLVDTNKLNAAVCTSRASLRLLSATVFMIQQTGKRQFDTFVTDTSKFKKMC